jgi:hypothetical protein
MRIHALCLLEWITLLLQRATFTKTNQETLSQQQQQQQELLCKGIRMSKAAHTANIAFSELAGQLLRALSRLAIHNHGLPRMLAKKRIVNKWVF